MRTYRQRIAIAMLIFIGTALAHTARAEDPMQILVSATPARINLPSVTPLTFEPAELLPTATWTPTPLGTAMLEAKTEANIRAQPDPESERLGSIRAGELYPILGRYYRWLQFQYDSTHVGWVYDELVNIIGDQSTIADLTTSFAPDPTAAAATQTQEVITLTPGADLTLTASGGVLVLPEVGNADGGGLGTEESGPVLPTYTYPPDLLALAPTANPDVEATATPAEGLPLTGEKGLPPIVPIAILGGLGLLGLWFSSVRR